MHGIILSELKRYVQARHGDPAWYRLLQDIGRPGAHYLASEVYGEEEATAIVAAASRASGVPVPTILEDFGAYMAPHLLEIYRPILPSEWRTLDIIEKTEQHIHRVVRSKIPGAAPPELRCRRVSDREVILTYVSPRRLCHVAKGIGRGLAHHLGETVEIDESACMHSGAPACSISFRKAD